MSCYWAKFEKLGNSIFRYDTIIYLNQVNSPGNNDKCIGAIVGKKPGSARHTQGMRHELVIPYISDILKSMTLEKSSS